MNSRLLKAVMVKHGDTGRELAAALGITRTTLSHKMTEYRGMSFTQREIMLIKERYALTAEDIETIFFTQKVS